MRSTESKSMNLFKSKRSKTLLITIVLSMILAACQKTPILEPVETDHPETEETLASPEQTPEPTRGKTQIVLGGDLPDDPVPEWTKAAEQALTEIANATPTSTPAGNVIVGEQAYQVFQGGYSLELSLDAHVSVRGPMTWVRSRETPTNTMIMGNISKYELVSLEELRPQVFASLFGSDAEIKEEEPQEYELDGVKGIAVDYVAKVSQMVAKGRLIVVKPTEKRYVAVIGMGDPADPSGDQWVKYGVDFFEMTLNGFNILSDEALADHDVCPFADDESYGLSMENPIRVGGGSMEGPARARAYLDNLKGNDGQWAVYERSGSLEGDGTILDAYQVQVDGEIITLYVDQYNFETLLTPKGLQCSGAYPIVAP